MEFKVICHSKKKVVRETNNFFSELCPPYTLENDFSFLAGKPKKHYSNQILIQMEVTAGNWEGTVHSYPGYERYILERLENGGVTEELSLKMYWKEKTYVGPKYLKALYIPDKGLLEGITIDYARCKGYVDLRKNSVKHITGIGARHAGTEHIWSIPLEDIPMHLGPLKGSLAKTNITYWALRRIEDPQTFQDILRYRLKRGI